MSEWDEDEDCDDVWGYPATGAGSSEESVLTDVFRAEYAEDDTGWPWARCASLGLEALRAGDLAQARICACALRMGAYPDLAAVAAARAAVVATLAEAVEAADPVE